MTKSNQTLNKQLKIAFVANTAWSIHNFRSGIIQQLLGMNHQVIVIAPQNPIYSAKLKDLGCDFKELQLDNQGTNLWTDFKNLTQLYQLYRAIQPDMIFHYTIKLNIYGAITAFLNRIPCISVVCGTGYTFRQKNGLYYWVLCLYRIAFSLARKVWFLNPTDKAFFETKQLVPALKTCLLPGEGINTTFFKRTSPRQFVGKYVFLLTARLIWDKGIQEYVEAARLLRQKYGVAIECQLLGFLKVENPAAIPEATVQTWHQQGTILYKEAVEDVRPHLEQAHCLVLPSYSEGVSRSLLEAASMELPIITTDTPGCRTVVEDGVNGFLVQAKNSIDLAAKMEQMFLLPREIQTQMGQRGRQKVVTTLEENLVTPYYIDVLKTLSKTL